MVDNGKRRAQGEKILKNESLHSLYVVFILFSSKSLKLYNQISQLWKKIESNNLEVFLRTIEGISRPNIKNHLIIPLTILSPARSSQIESTFLS